MSEKTWIELAAFLSGGVCGVLVLKNNKTIEKGIGPRTIQALILCLVVPVILSLSLEKALSPEAIAALVGGVIGYAFPRTDRE